VAISTYWYDEDGAQDLDWCFFLVAPNPYNAADIVFLHYNPEDNTMWLVNDAGTGWHGPGTPGSAGYLENSKVTVNCGLSGVEPYSNGYLVTWQLSFSHCYVGMQNMYLYCKDQAGLTSGAIATQVGTWTITGSGNTAPSVSWVDPSSGASSAGTVTHITTQWWDDDGPDDLVACMFLIGPSASSAVNAILLYYDPIGNLLWLGNDAGTGWLGGYAPGSDNVISNSRADLLCLSSQIFTFSFGYHVEWAIRFKTPAAGAQNTYLYARDSCGATDGWDLMGTWTVAPSAAPQVGAVSPNSGSSISGRLAYFTTSWTDANGWEDLDWCFFLVAPNTSSAANIVFLHYNPEDNTLWLVKDDASGWEGPGTPGTAGTLSNGKATLNCGLTTASRSGNTAEVTWAISFKAAYVGTKNLYLYVKDHADLSEGNVLKGTWTIQASQAPHVGTVSPTSGSSTVGEVVSFTTTWTDGNGWQDLDECFFAVAPNLSSPANIVFPQYHPQDNTLWLVNDAGTGLLGPKTPGVAGTLSNSQGTLYCGQTTVVQSGNTVQVTWALSFKTAYKGTKNLYLYVSDLGGATEGPTQKGTWTIN